MLTKNKLLIVGGPSKFDLMVSLFAKQYGPQPDVVFELLLEAKNYVSSPAALCTDVGGLLREIVTNRSMQLVKGKLAKVVVAIWGVERSDGSGENWNFTVYVKRSLGEGCGLEGRLKGVYTTTERCGWFEVEASKATL